MAATDLTITEANVKFGTAGPISQTTGILGATIGRCVAVYLDSNSRYQKANCGAQSTASVDGITFSNGVSGDKVSILTDGTRFVTGATMVVGETYVLSNTDGNIMKNDDLASGNYITTLILAISTTEAVVQINNTGETVA